MVACGMLLASLVRMNIIKHFCVSQSSDRLDSWQGHWEIYFQLISKNHSERNRSLRRMGTGDCFAWNEMVKSRSFEQLVHRSPFEVENHGAYTPSRLVLTQLICMRSFGKTVLGNKEPC